MFILWLISNDVPKLQINENQMVKCPIFVIFLLILIDIHEQKVTL
jgi:hypothetical protein